MMTSPENETAASPLRWGVLSTAKIARKYVIPAMMQAGNTQVLGIASRRADAAAETAAGLGIARSYGSYEALLADPDIDAVYNPLPNHLHAEWTIKALEAGKHVLCEKPLGLDTAEVAAMRKAAEARPRQLLMEAFMYRHHPQWNVAIEEIRRGRIGRVQLVQAHFSYYNTNKNDIRNTAAFGGGGLLDIGCYCVSSARWIFGREPLQVVGHQIHHPETGVDIITTGMMDFGDGMATFSCGTAVNAWQGIIISGTDGRIEIPVPFNPPAEKPALVRMYAGGGEQRYEAPAVNHFTRQAEAFARCLREAHPPLISLAESAANMHAVDQIRRSAREGRWIPL